MLLQIFLFLVGLWMLIKGGDWFVDSASEIARRFHLPELLIGATVVSIGTTLPEVMVSAQGAMAGSGGMAYGNAIGSIICNTALIAAITVAIKPGKVDRKALVLPITFFFAAALFYVIVAYFFGEFARWVGIVLLGGFVAYMIAILLGVKGEKEKGIVEVPHEEPDFSKNSSFSFFGFLLEGVVVLIGGAFMFLKGGVIRYIGLAMILLFLIYPFLVLRSLKGNKEIELLRALSFLGIGAAVIAGGANLLVDSGIYIAETFGVPDTVIALTFVALGTSLPEFVTAITSLIKGHGALSLGNVIGANLFNLVLVSGVSTVISPFGVPAESTIAGHPASLVLDLPVMLGVMMLLTIPALIRGKLSRVQGMILLCIYAGFCTLQFII